MAKHTIRQLREAQGWTQLELANKLGVTPATVYTWERGKFDPRASQLRKLSLAFGVSMDDIAIAVDEAGDQGKAAACVSTPPPLSTVSQAPWAEGL